MVFRLRCMASATGGTSSCSATTSAFSARIASSMPSVFELTNSWLNVTTRSGVPGPRRTERAARKRGPKSARKTTSGSAVTTYIQRRAKQQRGGHEQKQREKEARSEDVRERDRPVGARREQPERREHDDTDAVQCRAGDGQPACCPEMIRVKDTFVSSPLLLHHRGAVRWWALQGTGNHEAVCPVGTRSTTCSSGLRRSEARPVRRRSRLAGREVTRGAGPRVDPFGRPGARARMRRQRRRLRSQRRWPRARPGRCSGDTRPCCRSRCPPIRTSRAARA